MLSAALLPLTLKKPGIGESLIAPAPSAAALALAELPPAVIAWNGAVGESVILYGHDALAANALILAKDASWVCSAMPIAPCVLVPNAIRAGLRPSALRSWYTPGIFATGRLDSNA